MAGQQEVERELRRRFRELKKKEEEEEEREKWHKELWEKEKEHWEREDVKQELEVGGRREMPTWGRGKRQKGSWKGYCQLW